MNVHQFLGAVPGSTYEVAKSGIKGIIGSAGRQIHTERSNRIFEMDCSPIQQIGDAPFAENRRTSGTSPMCSSLA
jgi:hypothetical protein